MWECTARFLSLVTLTFDLDIQTRPSNQLNMSSMLVSWSLTSLFSTNMAISEMKGQGWKVIRTQ